MNFDRLKLFGLLSLVLLFGVACGAQIEQDSASDVDQKNVLESSNDTVVADSPADTNPLAAQDQVGVENTPATNLIAVQEGSGVTLRDGVEVGFTEDGHAYMGNLNAPVVIEEYSDYQCPFCQRFVQQSMNDIKSNQIAAGDAVLIFYDFPLTSIHPQAVAAANAARCAGEQGAAQFWDMHDALFADLNAWRNDPASAFSQLAQGIGLDVAAFDQCVAENRHEPAVQADLQAGQQAGVRGTPTFVINGELMSGALPAATFAQAVERAKAGEAVVQAPPTPNLDDIEAPEPVQLSDNFAGALGDPNAPVTIVEFTDYQCPFCGRHSSQTLPALLSEFVDTGRVYYIMKDLPLDQIHPLARDAAVAARCAGEQEAYWEMHDVLFEAQSEWSQSADLNATFTAYADNLGLETGAYGTCLTSGKYDALIQENIEEAQALGIGGTPFFIVDGFPVISGAQSLQVFQQVIGFAENDELVDRIMEAQRQQLLQQQQQQQQQAQPPQPTGPVDVPEGDSYAIGDPDAPVTIVEYTDFQCPFCQRHYQNTFAQIKANYIDTGLVRYVFKDFPLTSIHPQAVLAAEAARCAGEQNAYLEMHGLLFSKQREWGSNNAESIFNGYATDLGLDGGAFATCIGSGKYTEAVNAEVQEGAGLGVRGTPAFFVNGMFVNGAQPYSVFEQAIDAAIDG